MRARRSFALPGARAIDALVSAGDRIGHALIASDLPGDWGRALNELVADEYPHVRCAMVRTS